MKEFGNSLRLFWYDVCTYLFENIDKLIDVKPQLPRKSGRQNLLDLFYGFKSVVIGVNNIDQYRGLAFFWQIFIESGYENALTYFCLE